MTLPVRNHRLAVVTGLPTPYREPIFAELANRPGIDLSVFYAAEKHDDVGWQDDSNTTRPYRHVFLRNSMPQFGRRWPLVGYLSLGLPRALADFQPDYFIVYGYNQLSQWLAFRYATQHGVPFALRSDSNIHLDRSTTTQSNIRRWLLRRLVRRAHAVLPVGIANREYWMRYGARPEQVFMSPFAVDNERIASLTHRSDEFATKRLRLGYIGRLLPRKGVDLLIDAFEEVAPTMDAELVIIGDGPERQSFQIRQSAEMAKRTQWLGRLSNAEAISHLANLDALILPSRHEPWGLVVNEAMAAGVPVVAHRHVGAALDLVRHGETGWIFKDHTSQAIVAALREVADARARLGAIRSQVRHHIARWSIERCVDGMVAAVVRALGPTDTTLPLPAEVSHEHARSA